MKIDVTAIIINRDGRPFEMQVSETESVPMTFRRVCVEALDTPLVGDDKSSAEDKRARDALATRIYNAEKVVEISTQEAALLQARINMRFVHPRVVAQAWSMLDGQV